MVMTLQPVHKGRRLGLDTEHVRSALIYISQSLPEHKAGSRTKEIQWKIC